jgi:hypothetical protein
MAMPVGSGVARFKIVISATRHGVRLYPSIDALPPERQRQARHALDGELAATLLIADRTGLDRMRRWMGQSGLQKKGATSRLSLTRCLAAGFLATAGIVMGVLIWSLIR